MLALSLFSIRESLLGFSTLSLSRIGEGNGNPLQCSCLENPRDGGAWWAAFYGVAQSWTWLKWLSSSSSLLAWRVSIERSAIILMGIPLCVICCLSLAAFNICSLCLIFISFINLCLGMFLCIDHWGRLSNPSLLFFGTLHSNGCIFPLLLCLSLLFFSQLFVRPPQTIILCFCIPFSWGSSWSLPPIQFRSLCP